MHLKRACAMTHERPKPLKILHAFNRKEHRTDNCAIDTSGCNNQPEKKCLSCFIFQKQAYILQERGCLSCFVFQRQAYILQEGATFEVNKPKKSSKRFENIGEQSIPTLVYLYYLSVALSPIIRNPNSYFLIVNMSS